MIGFLTITVNIFVAFLIYQLLLAIFQKQYINTKVLSAALLCAVLFSGAYVLAVYAQAQGKADYIENLCGTELTPLTIIFYPEVADVEVDYCLDTLGSNPTPTNP
jgi:hypothetical protein